jgi:NitT/TauT family transport system substrate-binding protein
MFSKQPVFCLILVLIISLSASCTGGAQSPASKPIRVEWTLWQGDYTLLVADKMGFFKKHGLIVEPVRYDSASQAIPDLASAKLDGGLFTMMDTILASNLVDIKAIMVSDNNDRYALVASPDIETIRDLRGKRIGFNIHTPSEMFVYYMLQSQNMTLNDVTYVEMSPDRVAKSIPSQIDAGLVWEPYITQALEQGKKILYQSDYYSTNLPKLVVFRKAIIEQRPNDIRAFILAWEEAVQYRITHTQESLAIIVKATGLPATEIALASSRTLYTISSNMKIFANNPGTDPNSIYFIARFNRDFLVTRGYITNPPDINTLLDPSFLK